MSGRRKAGRERRVDKAAGGTSRTGRAEIARGHEALARGEWEGARTSFEAALDRRASAEALEGLGMAAFWLDDCATIFDARERAYDSYRRRGDRRGAGRVALALADDYFSFRGETAVARGWLERARSLLEGLEQVAEHGWLELWEGHFLLETGEDPARVRTLAVGSAATGRRLGDVDLEMTGLALEGLALVIQGELSDGMPRLDEASAAVVSGEMSDPVAIGRSCCLLVAACERARDYGRAAQWCRRIKAFCLRARLGFPLAICRTQYAGVLLFRGAWLEAEEELGKAVQLAAARPPLQQEALVCLANLRRQQGRLAEAAALLQQVDGHPLSILGRAALALDRSEPADAAHLARRFLRQLPRLNRSDRVAALDVLLRAHLALGQGRDARVSLEELRSIADLFATEPMKASALAAEGLVALAEGDHTRARNAFEDASELYARSGAPFERARCRVELARVYVALGERDAADAELRAALLTFEGLGAQGQAADTTALLRDLGARVATPGERSSGRLTHREVEVVRLVARGMSNQEIGKQLGVSEFTVKRHVANLLGKLRVSSRAAAAAYAAREGLA